jgi:hypothetical protein
MPYLGWRIFACRLNEDSVGESKRSLINCIRKSFAEDHWSVEDEDDGLLISQIETGREISARIEWNDLPIKYAIGEEEDQTEIESYVVSMRSESLLSRFSRRVELKHKKFMKQILMQLPRYWQKVGCYAEEGNLMLAWSNNIEPPFEPFPVKVSTLDRLPIPEEPPPRLKHGRTHVVKHRSRRRPKQGKETNTIKQLMEDFDREKLSHVTQIDSEYQQPNCYSTTHQP